MNMCIETRAPFTEIKFVNEDAEQASRIAAAINTEDTAGYFNNTSMPVRCKIRIGNKIRKAVAAAHPTWGEERVMAAVQDACASHRSRHNKNT